MFRFPLPHSRSRTLAAGVALALLPIGAMFAMTTAAQAAPAGRLRPQGPCDIYALAGTPCVAAHSTTRALYASYDGPLYQVRRLSDGRVKDIGVVSPSAGPVPDAGGYADAGERHWPRGEVRARQTWPNQVEPKALPERCPTWSSSPPLRQRSRAHGSPSVLVPAIRAARRDDELEKLPPCLPRQALAALLARCGKRVRWSRSSGTHSCLSARRESIRVEDPTSGS